jgi:predicted dehydrogenase
VEAFAAHPNSQVDAICAKEEDALTATSKEHGVSRCYTDFADIVSDPGIDLLVIATPHAMHADMAVKALRSGKHVIVEKPMCISLQECEEMIRAVEETGNLLAVDQVLRFYPYYQSVKEHVVGGGLGDVYYAEADYLHNTANLIRERTVWRGAVEHSHYPILGGGSHSLDMLRWLVGEVDRVHCEATRRALPDFAFPDCMVATLNFANGAVGKCTTSYGLVRSTMHNLVLFGTEGSIERARGMNDKDKQFRSSPGHEAEEEEWPVPFKPPGGKPIAAVAEHVYQCVMRNETPLTNVWEGANTVAVALAAIESWQTGKPVQPAHFTPA